MVILPSIALWHKVVSPIYFIPSKDMTLLKSLVQSWYPSCFQLPHFAISMGLASAVMISRQRKHIVLSRQRHFLHQVKKHAIKLQLSSTSLGEEISNNFASIFAC